MNRLAGLACQRLLQRPLRTSFGNFAVLIFLSFVQPVIDLSAEVKDCTGKAPARPVRLYSKRIRWVKAVLFTALTEQVRVQVILQEKRWPPPPRQRRLPN